MELHVKVKWIHDVRVRVQTVKKILVTIIKKSIPQLEFLACIFLSSLMMEVSEAVKDEVTLKNGIVGLAVIFHCGG